MARKTCTRAFKLQALRMLTEQGLREGGARGVESKPHTCRQSAARAAWPAKFLPAGGGACARRRQWCAAEHTLFPLCGIRPAATLPSLGIILAAVTPWW